MGNLDDYGYKAGTHKQEDDGDFSIIPDGWYLASIEKATIKPNKNKNGELISITFTIEDEEFKNRKVWENLNIKNPSEKTVKVAFAILDKIKEAIGKPKLSDTDELIDEEIFIKTKKVGKFYDVKDYKSVDDGSKLVASGGKAEPWMEK